jgi:hypothetical protein
VIEYPGQCQTISAASAVSARGAFWFATCEGGLTGELFVSLLQQLMYRRKTPVHLVVDGLPAHKQALVKEYVASTQGKLTLHFLPGYTLPTSTQTSWCGAMPSAPGWRVHRSRRARNYSAEWMTNSNLLPQIRLW